ncbi:MAG: glycoside hydrolase family 127 protein, partial [Candidatus Aminicenantes bacterium]|nr:glycoside hydrolase family 127 protein [Candidatus Aminicenantes bacterium]
MNKRSIALILSLLAGFGLWLGLKGLPAQTAGDQILDGIGETALIARYIFDGNTEDRSRNHFHAVAVSGEPTYPEERPFGKVLFLQGGALRLPGRALAGIDNLSVTCWVNLDSADPGQVLFDFGGKTGRGLFCLLTGPDEASGFRVGTSAADAGGGQELTSKANSSGRWFHVAVVLDAAHSTLTGYVMGREVGRVEDLKMRFEDILDRDQPDQNRLFIGRALDSEEPGLRAKLRDLRLYSISLSEEQVRAIAFGAAGGMGGGRRRAVEPAAPALRSLALGLRAVPDISVETTTGVLPHLPVRIPGIYENGVSGPPVRVIWPSPADNSAVLNPGTYTVTGTVPGTAFQPKAVVSVKPAEAPAAAAELKRLLEPFPLGRVVLNRDIDGRDTLFMKNRDKFITMLAKVNPDNFLYNFRDAFGLPQPAGAVQLGGWDDQTTRLRGHATGHYLSALAQAYAGSVYDAALQANFLKKMNDMIDTLYDLSQKSGRPAEAGGPCNSDPTTVPPGPG